MSPEHFDGTWRNQRGSTLSLSITNGTVSGKFESAVGDGGKLVEVEVGGRVLGDQIVFHTAYEHLKMLVSWVGQLTTTAGNDRLETTWLHGSDVVSGDEPQGLWGSVRVGSDTFTRVR